MTKCPEFGYKRVKFCDVNKPESYSDVSLKGKDNKLTSNILTNYNVMCI